MVRRYASHGHSSGTGSGIDSGTGSGSGPGKWPPTAPSGKQHVGLFPSVSGPGLLFYTGSGSRLNSRMAPSAPCPAACHVIRRGCLDLGGGSGGGVKHQSNGISSTLTKGNFRIRHPPRHKQRLRVSSGHHLGSLGALQTHPREVNQNERTSKGHYFEGDFRPPPPPSQTPRPHLGRWPCENRVRLPQGPPTPSAQLTSIRSHPPCLLLLGALIPFCLQPGCIRSAVHRRRSGGVPPPPGLPPLPMFEADSQILLRRLRCQKDFNFEIPPPSAGTIGGPREEGDPSQTPPPPF